MTGIFLASYMVLWALVVVTALLVFLLYRHFGVMAMGTADGVQRDGLPIGSVVSDFEAVTADGTKHTWRSRVNAPHLLVFAAPDCAPCAKLIPHLNSLVRHRPDLQVVVVAAGPESVARRIMDKFHPPFQALADDGRGVHTAFRVRVTPFCFVIGADGVVQAKGLCSDHERLADLMRTAGLDHVASDIEASAVAVRDLVPTTNGRPDFVIGISTEAGR
jgi:methylamine dehydrogenase accessory protein MauD